MRLRYIQLHNYRRFREAALEFPDGVMGVIGPNGAGKSTLIEAVSWALYGNPVNRTTKEEVRRAQASPKEECSVLLEFEIGGDQYRLRRWMKGKSLSVEATLEVNGGLEASGDVAVSRAVKDHLSMDYRAFFISVFARQRELNALASFPPHERRKLVLRMLDVDVLDQVIKDVDADGRDTGWRVSELRESLLDGEGKERIETVRKEMKGIDGDLEDLLDNLSQERERLEGVDRELEVARQHRDEVSARERQFRELKNRVENEREGLGHLGERRERVAEEMERLLALRGEAKDIGDQREHLGQLEEEKNQMEERRAQQLERNNLKDNMERIMQEERQLEERLGERREEREGLEKGLEEDLAVKDELEDMDDRIERTRDRLAHLKSEMSNLEGKAEETRSRREHISEMGPESPCPTCERPLEDQYENLLERMSEELDELEGRLSVMGEEKDGLESELKVMRERRGFLQGRYQELQRNMSRVESLGGSIAENGQRLEELGRERERIDSRLSELDPVHFDRGEYDRLKEDIDRVRRKVERFNEIRVELKRLPRLREEVGELEDQMEGSRERIVGLEDELGEMDYREGELEAAQEKLDALIEDRQSLSEMVGKIQGDIRVKRSDRRHREERLEELRKRKERLKELHQDWKMLSELSEVMKRFRENVISRIIPALGERSTSLFVEMTDARYQGIELDEDYRIHVYDSGERYEIDRFSGGEGDLANLCLRLAISRVISDRSGSPVNFLVLDEIFGSQDQQRKRNIMRTLNSLSRQFRQIVLITHIDDMKEFMENVVYVRENEDGSSDLVLGT